jgi:hypothetical protein
MTFLRQFSECDVPDTNFSFGEFTAMTENKHSTVKSSSRRQFLRQTSIGLAGIAAFSRLPLVHAAPLETDMTVKIGLIGCGGRGTGAVLDALGAATKVIYPAAGYHTEDVAEGAKVERPNIQVVALADLFEDRLTKCKGELELGIDIPKVVVSLDSRLQGTWDCRKSIM